MSHISLNIYIILLCSFLDRERLDLEKERCSEVKEESSCSCQCGSAITHQRLLSLPNTADLTNYNSGQLTVRCRIIGSPDKQVFSPYKTILRQNMQIYQFSIELFSPLAGHFFPSFLLITDYNSAVLFKFLSHECITHYLALLVCMSHTLVHHLSVTKMD